MLAWETQLGLGDWFPGWSTHVASEHWLLSGSSAPAVGWGPHFLSLWHFYRGLQCPHSTGTGFQEQVSEEKKQQCVVSWWPTLESNRASFQVYCLRESQSSIQVQRDETGNPALEGVRFWKSAWNRSYHCSHLCEIQSTAQEYSSVLGLTTPALRKLKL